MRTARKNAPDLHSCDRISILIHAFRHNLSRAARCDHMICLYNHISVLVLDRIAGETAGNTLFQRLNHLLALGERLDPDSRNFLAVDGAVRLADHQVL